MIPPGSSNPKDSTSSVKDLVVYWCVEIYSDFKMHHDTYIHFVTIDTLLWCHEQTVNVSRYVINKTCMFYKTDPVVKKITQTLGTFPHKDGKHSKCHYVNYP